MGNRVGGAGGSGSGGNGRDGRRGSDGGSGGVVDGDGEGDRGGDISRAVMVMKSLSHTRKVNHHIV